jgi:hypothetical protein
MGPVKLRSPSAPAARKMADARKKGRLPQHRATVTYSNRAWLAPQTTAQTRHRRRGRRSHRLPLHAARHRSPRDWRHFSAAAKVEHLIGLDRCREILSWPPDELDPVRRSMRMQVLRIGIKALLDSTLGREARRERDRDRILGQLIDGLDERAARRS